MTDLLVESKSSLVDMLPQPWKKQALDIMLLTVPAVVSPAT